MQGFSVLQVLAGHIFQPLPTPGLTFSHTPLTCPCSKTALLTPTFSNNFTSLAASTGKEGVPGRMKKRFEETFLSASQGDMIAKKKKYGIVELCY